MLTQMIRAFVLATGFLVVSAAPGLAQAQTGTDPEAATGSTARQTARPILTAAFEHARSLPGGLARDIDGQTSGVGEAQEAARDQAVASSFEALPPLLKAGQTGAVSGVEATQPAAGVTRSFEALRSLLKVGVYPGFPKTSG